MFQQFEMRCLEESQKKKSVLRIPLNITASGWIGSTRILLLKTNCSVCFPHAECDTGVVFHRGTHVTQV